MTEFKGCMLLFKDYIDFPYIENIPNLNIIDLSDDYYEVEYNDTLIYLIREKDVRINVNDSVIGIFGDRSNVFIFTQILIKLFNIKIFDITDYEEELSEITNDDYINDTEKFKVNLRSYKINNILKNKRQN